MTQNTALKWDMDHPDWYNREKGREKLVHMPDWAAFIVFVFPLIATFAVIIGAALWSTVAAALTAPDSGLTTTLFAVGAVVVAAVIYLVVRVFHFFYRS